MDFFGKTSILLNFTRVVWSVVTMNAIVLLVVTLVAGKYIKRKRGQVTLLGVQGTREYSRDDCAPLHRHLTGL
jgi:hypothetical protein